MADLFERWVKVEVEGLKSPQQRSRALAAFAREDIAKERLANDQRLGKKGRRLGSPSTASEAPRSAP